MGVALHGRSDSSSAHEQFAFAQALRGTDQRSAAAAAVALGINPPPGMSVERIRQIRDIRAKRREFFPGGMFSDPAWEILLTLYAAHLEQQRLSITRLAAEAQVPATTVLRWMSSLEVADLIVRTGDITDNRRVFVRLSQKGVLTMNSYFTACGARIAFA